MTVNKDKMQSIGGDISHIFGGNLYSKEMKIPSGMIAIKHTHDFTHLSILASGNAIVEIDGVSKEICGPACLTIEAGKEHKVIAITDIVWYCIHTAMCTDVDNVDNILIGRD